MSDTEAVTDEVKILEELFQDRYTETDARYMDEVSRCPSNPPVVYPWSFKFKQSFSRQLMYRGGRHGDRFYDRPRSGNQSWWRDGDPSWCKQGSSRQRHRDREPHEHRH